MRFEAACLVVLVVWSAVAGAGAKEWRFPDASVRIDTKVHFTDSDLDENVHLNANRDDVQMDEQVEQAPDDGRTRTRGETHRAYAPRGLYNNAKKSQRYYSDGTLDSLQFCKCVSTPECTPSIDSAKACGLGKFLCCYTRPHKRPQENSEFFNEVDDERPILLPGQGVRAGPFPPAPDRVNSHEHGHSRQPVLVGPNGSTGRLGPPNNPQVLVGPEGPTGLIGPAKNPQVLIGPDGPTGVVGPPRQNNGILVGPGGPTSSFGLPQQNYGLLVGEDGPTGVIGPVQQNGVLVGPDGPTGEIGPASLHKQHLDMGSSGSAQRGILVGPGGPTGFIGPAGYVRRPVLVGPGGPTGIIGPYGGGRRNQGVLVGPGGPTGLVGPPRRPYYGK